MPAVPTTEPLCRMDGIASFRPGVQNGVPYTADQLHAAVENFHAFSQGSPPHYTPYISLNHNDHLAFGKLTDARMAGDTLTLDGADIPHSVGAMVNGKQLRQPSIEFFLPNTDPATGRIVGGFRGPDGAVVTSPVIKCLTFLGNLPPAVKGLPDLPVATFAHRSAPTTFGGFVRTFSGVPTMDRAAMLQALTDAGMDVSGITDVVPDEVLQAMLDVIQDKAVAPQEAAPEVGAPVVAPMTAAPVVTAHADPLAAAGSGATPSAITVKFTDAAGKAVDGGAYLKGLNDQLAGLKARVDAESRRSVGHADAAKRATVKRFLDEMAADPKGARIPPAQRPYHEKVLLAADAVAVVKFADGKTSGTALDELMRDMRAWPVVRTFGDQMAAAVPKAGMTPERRAELLKTTPEGKLVLKREAAAAAK